MYLFGTCDNPEGEVKGINSFKKMITHLTYDIIIWLLYFLHIDSGITKTITMRKCIKGTNLGCVSLTTDSVPVLRYLNKIPIDSIKANLCMCDTDLCLPSNSVSAFKGGAW